MWARIFHRRYLISLFYMLIIIIGVIAWRNIALERAPNLSLPSITVNYTWGSTSPEVMEKEVTSKVEEIANRLKNVQKVQSESRSGRSSVTITFAPQTPVEYRMVELREYLTALNKTLPSNVGQPSISRQVPKQLRDMQTFVVYSLSGNMPVHKLLEYTERNIRLPMMGISGVADINISGARDPALTIEFNTNKMDKFGLSPRQIMFDIDRQLQWRPSGYLQASGRQISLLVPPQFRNIQSIRKMQIQLPYSPRRVQLSDLARVSIQDYPAKTFRRINGSPALSISFEKESGVGAIGLAEKIQAQMTKVGQSLPPGMNLRLARDATKKLRKQFGQLRFESLFSIIVVFIILLFFIRRFRAPFVILGSIAFSLMVSISALYFAGYTLNIITLAGLTISLGMIVDNAVVVFEQVNPYLPPNRAARFDHIKKNLPRTFVPVLGSTFTTVGIFIPLFFAAKQLRIFLGPLAVALSLTLISSIFISMTWIPYSLIWLTPSKPKESSKRKTRKQLFDYLRRPALWLFYWRHRLRWLFLVALILTIGIPLFAIKEPNWSKGTQWPAFTKVYFNNRQKVDSWIGGLSYRFFNNTYFGSPFRGPKQKKIYITIQPPQGTPVQEIDQMARNFEKIAIPYKNVFSFYQTYVSAYSGARLVFYIKDSYLTSFEPYIYYNKAQYLASRTGNAAISVSGLGNGMYTGFGTSSVSQRIQLTGYSYDGLLELAKSLKRRLKQNRRVRSVDINQTSFFGGSNTYQYHLDLNNKQLALRGLNRGSLLNAVALDINPTNSFGKVHLNNKELFLIGRNAKRQFYPKGLMQEKRVGSKDSVIFDLHQVSNLDKQKVQSTIRRVNQAYERTISIDFLGPYRLAQDYIKKVIKETPVPVGEKIKYGRSFIFGTSQKTRNILLLIGLTILCVWMIVSALLEDWIDPLVVICAVPLGFIGVMAGTQYFGLAFGRDAIAGVLLVVGVGVNNAILLIHERKYFRLKGVHGLRSWLYVYRNKMRPVLITTLTAIGGMVPMIIFGKSQFWSALATITVCGLISSTILILGFIGTWEKVEKYAGKKKKAKQ